MLYHQQVKVIRNAGRSNTRKFGLIKFNIEIEFKEKPHCNLICTESAFDNIKEFLLLVAQSCPTLCDFTRLLCPQNFLGKNTGVGCHFLY